MKHTKVIFLKEKPEGLLTCNVFAFFPNLNYYSTGNIGYGGVTSDNWQDMKISYAHIGQHSACHENYAKGCKQAEYREYRELLRELIGQGYKDLRIMNTQIFSYHRKPTPSEIKQGYGATRWMDFLAADCVGKAGKVKKWVKGPDGLRYS